MFWYVLSGLAANSHEKHCLTIDCSYQNKNDPGRYRSSDDNLVEQVCCFNKPNDDEYYNIFTSKRMKERDMITEFILKLKRLEVEQIEKTLMLKKHWKMAQAMLDFHEFSLLQSQN